jgi:hypothetical protein
MMFARLSDFEFSFTSTASKGLLTGSFDFGLATFDLVLALDAKKAFTSGVGHSQAQKNLPKRIVTRTTRPTESQASGTKVLLANVVCKKPSGQVNEIPKRSNEQVFPHTKWVTVPARMTSMRTVAVIKRIALTVMMFFFFAIDHSTSIKFTPTHA